ncbi:MAG: hypothetical protein MOB07_13230 [Acidobacteria bacterium]|nr:hypothetical protein [Acidobacteriota bacterium]
MQTTRKVAPGQKGAKKLLKQYGARLLCVRYRYDATQGKRFKTVELIIEEAALVSARPHGEKEAGRHPHTTTTDHRAEDDQPWSCSGKMLTAEASNTEEPGAGKLHAGICAGGVG